MGDIITRQEAIDRLRLIYPHLADFINAFGQDNASLPLEVAQARGCDSDEINGEIAKLKITSVTDNICNQDNFWGAGGSRECFKCVFNELGLDFDNSFTGYEGASTQLAQDRWRAILNGYFQVDTRIRDIVSDLIVNNPCPDLSLTEQEIIELPSILARLLGEGDLLVSMSVDDIPDRLEIGVKYLST